MTHNAENQTNLYLPKVGKGPDVAERSFRDEMFRILKESFWQCRANVYRHPLLDDVAQDRANDMLLRRYFGHESPDGVWPNQVVRDHGFPLPDWYSDDANNVESIALNYQVAKDVYAAWASSNSHWRHVTGSDPFFAGQECAGSGVAWGKEDAGIYIVLITAPCPEGWQP